MSNSRKTLFISDLHLAEHHPEITQQFYHLLANVDSQLDAIYILGDLFDAWIGDDEDTPFQREIISALRKATQKGLPIYFLWGNRDFFIGKKFLRETGCKKLRDEEKINLYGTPILLMHGDTLCTHDVMYLRARRISRIRFLQKLFLLLPLRLRKKIGDKARKKSQHVTQAKSPYIMDVVADTVEQSMSKHQVSYLIHGHTHRPGIHKFELNNNPAARFVLGAWHDGANGLIWYDTGEKRLIEL